MTTTTSRRVLGSFVLVCCMGTAGAQVSPGARLPQDDPVEPRPASRDAPITVDRDRFAEQAPDGAADLRFRLLGVELVGNTVLPRERFESLWAEQVGREVPLTAVFDIAARISAIYRESGFVLSQALVPQQDIAQSGSVVRIRVAEGFISTVTVGDGVAGAERIRRMLAPVLAERPLTLATLERSLLLLNDLPGVQARASLRAASEANAAEMDLLVERDRNAFSLATHNRTTSSVGPMRIEGSAERRGLLGDFDRHVLRLIGSGNERLRLVAYSGDAPVGYDGASVSWSASASKSKPRSGEAFRFDADSTSGSLGASYPVWRSRSHNVSVRVAFTAYDGTSDITDGLPVSEDRIRALRIGASADVSDSYGGVNLLDAELSKGLDGFGASSAGDPMLSRAGADPQFTKATLYVARLQSLGGAWSLLAAASGQYTGGLLLSSEQFGIGGDVFLRAYDPSEIAGDRGIAGKLEVRWNTAVERFAATAYAYWDSGRVDLLAADGTRTHQSALSAGGGVRVSGPAGVRGYVEVAKPRHRPTDRYGDERTRYFAGLGIDF